MFYLYVLVLSQEMPAPLINEMAHNIGSFSTDEPVLARANHLWIEEPVLVFLAETELSPPPSPKKKQLKTRQLNLFLTF